MNLSTRVALFLASCSLAVSACSFDDTAGPTCEGDACDEVLDAEPLKECSAAADFKTTTGELKCTPCGDVLSDRSGRGFLPQFIANDALVKKVYMTFEDKNKNKKIDADEVDCPLEMPAIMAKLAKTDKNGAKACNEVETRVVSETAAVLGAKKASYRAVTSRTCDKRDEFGLLFSSFGFSGEDAGGVDINTADHPGEVEIIAFDKTEGVFNFYKEVGGSMRFFGSSIDFVAAGPGGPSLTSTRGCANCHPGGGLNMKELQSPWTHWSLEDDIQGADTLVNSRKDYMGELTSGANMEFNITEPGNLAWNKSKAKFLTTVTTAELKAARKALKDDKLNPAQLADLTRRQLNKDLTATQAMLEPLFCSVQVNINAQGKFQVPGTLFAAQRNGVFFGGNIDSNDNVFDAALKLIKSAVPGIPGKTELTTEFMAVERSHEDATYVDELVRLKAIDEGLVRDVMMVDFSRPVFSDDRCDLLALVPDLAPADRKPAKIRDGLIANLKKAKAEKATAAGQLLAHLEASKAGTPFNHDRTLSNYDDACGKRPAKDVVRDGLKLRSLQRKLVFGADGALDTASGTGFHPMAVFEFEQTMPVDQVLVTKGAKPDSATEVHPDARFSPVDCSLVSEFVEAGSTGGDDDPDSSCRPRTGSEECGFRQGASCQCDPKCTMFDNCCSDFSEVCLQSDNK